jgi:ubiquinone/menaquinone biosynthesis C-methylase UbiE
MFHRSLSLSVVVPLLLVAQNARPATNRQIPALSAEADVDWLTRPQRDTEETPDTALDVIGIQPGWTVADVGAGTGYFSWRLGERAGETGKVYAVDVQPVMLDRIRNTIKEHGLSNVKVVRGSEVDPHLPAGKLDLVLVANAYDEFSHPREMLQKIREALKPEARLVVIEYREEGAPARVPVERRMSIQQIRAEIEPQGFRFDKVMGVLPLQHLVIFSKAR